MDIGGPVPQGTDFEVFWRQAGQGLGGWKCKKSFSAGFNFLTAAAAKFFNGALDGGN